MAGSLDQTMGILAVGLPLSRWAAKNPWEGRKNPSMFFGSGVGQWGLSIRGPAGAAPGDIPICPWQLSTTSQGHLAPRLPRYLNVRRPPPQSHNSSGPKLHHQIIRLPENRSCTSSSPTTLHQSRSSHPFTGGSKVISRYLLLRYSNR